MYISLIGAGVNIILNFICINIFGYIAAAYTTFVSFFIYFMGHYLFMSYILYKKERVTIFKVREMLAVSLSLVLLMISMSLLYSTVMLRYTVIATVLIIVLIMRKHIVQLLTTFVNC